MARIASLLCCGVSHLVDLGGKKWCRFFAISRRLSNSVTVSVRVCTNKKTNKCVTMVMEVLLLHGVTKGLFILGYSVEYTHHPMHCMQSTDSQLSCACVLRRNEVGLPSEGQENLRELSITPVGYFTGAIKNHSRAEYSADHSALLRRNNRICTVCSSGWYA
jgi:hypothetical protein